MFLCAACICLTFYGGGFATIPAYLADLFGTQFVGAIHGRLLTAWSCAGLVSPLIINVIRDTQIKAGVPKAQAYSVTLYIMACFLIVGFICAVLVKPVHSKHYMTAEQLQAAKDSLHAKVAAAQEAGGLRVEKPTSTGKLLLSWMIILVPLGYGVWQTVLQTAKMFVR